eukprot:GHRR01005935.1.p1 GENE.GHRR01005935.1~~GHRR01005935.1.p1  ORF type:complete len:181 (+),score=19.75 GHRR01005935.1:893-1435(+)
MGCTLFVGWCNVANGSWHVFLCLNLLTVHLCWLHRPAQSSLFSASRQKRTETVVILFPPFNGSWQCHLCYGILYAISISQQICCVGVMGTIGNSCCQFGSECNLLDCIIDVPCLDWLIMAAHSHGNKFGMQEHHIRGRGQGQLQRKLLRAVHASPAPSFMRLHENCDAWAKCVTAVLDIT